MISAEGANMLAAAVTLMAMATLVRVGAGDLSWTSRLDDSEPQPPRRITTKSLFVFPRLGPDAPPECPAGGCAKLDVVKLDRTAHLDFLLQKLNDRFADDGSSSDYYDYGRNRDGDDASGPLQLSVPIAEDAEDADPGSGDAPLDATGLADRVRAVGRLADVAVDPEDGADVPSWWRRHGWDARASEEAAGRLAVRHAPLSRRRGKPSPSDELAPRF